MSVAPDLLLDVDEHDLDIEGGDLKLAVDVGQLIDIRLRFFRGDWFLNTAIGLPYFEQIFVKNPKLDQLAALYRDEIAQTPGVVRVLGVSVALDRTTRRLLVTWSAETTEGDIGPRIVEVS